MRWFVVDVRSETWMYLSLRSPLNLPALLWGSYPTLFGSWILTDVQAEEFLQPHGWEWDCGVGSCNC